MQLNVRRWWTKMEFDRGEDMTIALVTIISLGASIINDSNRGTPGKNLLHNNLFSLVPQIVFLCAAGKFSL